MNMMSDGVMNVLTYGKDKPMIEKADIGNTDNLIETLYDKLNETIEAVNTLSENRRTNTERTKEEKEYWLWKIKQQEEPTQALDQETKWSHSPRVFKRKGIDCVAVFELDNIKKQAIEDYKKRVVKRISILPAIVQHGEYVCSQNDVLRIIEKTE